MYQPWLPFMIQISFIPQPHPIIWSSCSRINHSFLSLSTFPLPFSSGQKPERERKSSGKKCPKYSQTRKQHYLGWNWSMGNLDVMPNKAPKRAEGTGIKPKTRVSHWLRVQSCTHWESSWLFYEVLLFQILRFHCQIISSSGPLPKSWYWSQLP